MYPERPESFINADGNKKILTSILVHELNVCSLSSVGEEHEAENSNMIYMNIMA